MRIRQIILRRLEMALRDPFVTSYGVELNKHVIIVEVHTTNGAVGYAECVAGVAPFYTEETAITAWHMLSDFFVPAVLKYAAHHDIDADAELDAIRRILSPFRGNPMAKAALEMAVCDAYCCETNLPLAQWLGGIRQEIAVGISIGLQPDERTLLQKIDGYLQQGFARIKVKIGPGHDIEVVRAIRCAFGDIPLMVDANSAYTLDDVNHLRRFDDFGLTMMEQPLAVDDIVHHARLQHLIHTPICLDESIRSAEDARKAIDLGACRVINIKLGRVGGFGEAKAIHDVCLEHGIPVWCGGMLETGIGRLHNIQLTALPGFVYPGDTAPSARYFEEDLIHPPVEFVRPGYLAVEPIAGVGSRVSPSRLDKWQVAVRTFEVERA